MTELPFDSAEIAPELVEGQALRPATVAIVGRPNVGKSALFNRLIGQRLAIVEDTPGVTRDRLYALAEWRGRTFTCVDTGGIEFDVDPNDAIAFGTREQAETAARDADVIVFVVDAIDGLNPVDIDVAAILRRTQHPVLLVANKTESPNALASVHGEFSRLGFGEPFPVSAIHGEGTGDLLDAIVERLPPESEAAEPHAELALALIGQPNVGKSSLLNAILGENRTIVSDVPGTTRDSIDTLLPYGDRTLRLIDTAGVRKRADKHGAIEYYSMLRALRAIARCDIAILLVDGMKGPQNADRRLAGIAIEEKKGLIIVGNKYDLVRDQGEFSQNELIEGIHEHLPFAAFAPVTFLSALTKRRLGSLMPLVNQVAENLDRRIATSKLNTVVQDAVIAHPAPIAQDRLLKIFYCAQVSTHPPLFVFSCNEPKLVQPSYKRFIENVIRSNFDFQGVPLTLDFRERPRDEHRR
jgi:GTP-binding protein